MNAPVHSQYKHRLGCWFRRWCVEGYKCRRIGWQRCVGWYVGRCFGRSRRMSRNGCWSIRWLWCVGWLRCIRRYIGWCVGWLRRVRRYIGWCIARLRCTGRWIGRSSPRRSVFGSLSGSVRRQKCRLHEENFDLINGCSRVCKGNLHKSGCDRPKVSLYCLSSGNRAIKTSPFRIIY